jgi:hypothetical protein
MKDDIFSEVIHKRKNIFKTKQIGQSEEGYLIIEGNYSAHGETLKKAKEDLHFKIISEKLKKDPIKKDTIISIQYYRIITGACESGVKNWMAQNGIKKTKMKASELLPILKKTNGYGLQQFEKLITF